MPNSYDVDDILAEIKRKKSAMAMPEQNTQRPWPTAWDRVESSASVNAPAAEQLQQDVYKRQVYLLKMWKKDEAGNLSSKSA